MLKVTEYGSDSNALDVGLANVPNVCYSNVRNVGFTQERMSGLRYN